MHASLLTFTLTLLSLSSPRAVGTPVLQLPGPPEQQLLLGEWTLRITYAPSKRLPKGGQATGTEIWRAGPDGRSILEEYREEGDAGLVEGIGLVWFDATAGGQRFVWCGSGDPAGCTLSISVARWEGSQLVYSETAEQGGVRILREEIFRDINPDSFLQLLKEGPAVGDPTTVVTIRATRRVPSSKPPKKKPR